MVPVGKPSGALDLLHQLENPKHLSTDSWVVKYSWTQEGRLNTILQLKHRSFLTVSHYHKSVRYSESWLKIYRSAPIARVITITSQWARCRLKSPASGLFINCLFRCRSKKTSKLRVTGLCAENSPGPVNSPHKRPVTRKMLPFDDVIM